MSPRKSPTFTVDARSFGTVVLPVFDGYPYLISRIGHTPLRHIALVPADLPRERIIDLARAQASANRFDAAACLAIDDVVYVYPDGSAAPSGVVPAGDPVTDRLRLAEDFPETPELAARRARLHDFQERHRGTGYLIGDGLEHERPATPEDRARHKEPVPESQREAWACPDHGAEAIEVRASRYLKADYHVCLVCDKDEIDWPVVQAPATLRRCGICGGYAGPCLIEGRDVVVTCECACENPNRCARCGEPLSDRRLSAWYWDEGSGSPWYVAAYSGLGHRCADEIRTS